MELLPWQHFLQITTPQEDRRDDMKLYHKMTLSDLQKKAPFVSIQSSYTVSVTPKMFVQKIYADRSLS